jgi:cytochrome P450
MTSPGPTAPDARPVTDPTTDYDIFDPGFVADPYPAYAEVRERCPVGHTDRHQGSWMPTSYQTIQEIAHDVETFSSTEILVYPIEPAADGDPLEGIGAPPITSDPPEHQWSRKLILPAFSPSAVKAYEDGTRELCNRLIDDFIANGRCDAATDYAQQIPVRVIAAMLGVDDSRADEFVGWVRAILETGHIDVERRQQARYELLEFFVEQLADRRADPRDDDIITELVRATVDGEPLPESHILGTCNLILVAGIDTTWSAIGSSLWHLAQRSDHRRQLRDDPGLWPLAVEELLRAYSPVTMARRVTRDVEYRGCPMKEGDKVLMPFPAANRDPAVFDRPDEVRLDRMGNRHVAFGSGIHRCAGSNLARMELRVALQVFLERIPEFELAEGAGVTWVGGQVRGPRSCPVTFTPPST